MDSNIVSTQITIGVLLQGVLAYLKKAAWLPWFNKHSAKINHIYMLASSAVGALGIHAAWNSAEHSLLITGLSLAVIGHAMWEWMKQWSFQYLIQRGAFGPVSVPGDAPPIPVTPVLPEAKNP